LTFVIDFIKVQGASDAKDK